MGVSREAGEPSLTSTVSPTKRAYFLASLSLAEEFSRFEKPTFTLNTIPVMGRMQKLMQGNSGILAIVTLHNTIE